MGKATAAARAALPIPISVHSIFVWTPKNVWLPVFGIFIVHTDVDANQSSATHSCYGISVCSVFVWTPKNVCLSMFRIFNVRNINRC